MTKIEVDDPRGPELHCPRCHETGSVDYLIEHTYHEHRIASIDLREFYPVEDYEGAQHG